MEKPNLYERFHWAVFNTGVKFFGFLCPVWAVIFIVTIVIDYFKGSVWYDFGELATIIAVLFFILFGAVGVAIVRAKPYRPSKYTEYYQQQKSSDESNV